MPVATDTDAAHSSIMEPKLILSLVKKYLRFIQHLKPDQRARLENRTARIVFAVAPVGKKKLKVSGTKRLATSLIALPTRRKSRS